MELILVSTIALSTSVQPSNRRSNINRRSQTGYVFFPYLQLQYIPLLNITPHHCIEAIGSHNAPNIIYSDGSATAGTNEGEAAAILTDGIIDSPTVIDTMSKKSSWITSSFQEEWSALNLANILIDNIENEGKVLISSASQSLLRAVKKKAPSTRSLMDSLSTKNKAVNLQWVPGHADIPGNVLVWQKRRRQRKGEQTDVPSHLARTPSSKEPL